MLFFLILIIYQLVFVSEKAHPRNSDLDIMLFRAWGKYAVVKTASQISQLSINLILDMVALSVTWSLSQGEITIWSVVSRVTYDWFINHVDLFSWVEFVFSRIFTQYTNHKIYSQCNTHQHCSHKTLGELRSKSFIHRRAPYHEYLSWSYS